MVTTRGSTNTNKRAMSPVENASKRARITSGDSSSALSDIDSEYVQSDDETTLQPSSRASTGDDQLSGSTLANTNQALTTAPTRRGRGGNRGRGTGRGRARGRGRGRARGGAARPTQQEQNASTIDASSASLQSPARISHADHQPILDKFFSFESATDAFNHAYKNRMALSPNSAVPNDTVSMTFVMPSTMTYQPDITSGSAQQPLQLASSQPDPKNLAEPTGEPPVWANGRQALCETLPYYRGFQSAGYCHGGHARAFMFSTNAHARDFMDANVVVARAGGGMIRDKNGKMMQAADQTPSSQVNSVKTNVIDETPVVLLVGEGNPTISVKVPHPFCVMDWFKPTHVWCEKSQGRIIIRYRFEKLNTTEVSWWQPKGLDSVSLIENEAPVSASCITCRKPSQQVYTGDWMCLTSTCPRFWVTLNGKLPKENELRYDPRFLHQKTNWTTGDRPPHGLVPDVEDNSAPFSVESEVDVGWKASRGEVCPLCHCCSSRISWMSIECANEDCGHKRNYSLPQVRTHDLKSALFPLGDGAAINQDTFEQESVTFETRMLDNYRVNIFTFAGLEDCAIYHLMANQTAVQEQDGPDDMFNRLHNEGMDIGLRRRHMSGAVKGGMLTNHFALNHGMPYKYVAKVGTIPFNESSEPVRLALKKLNWASKKLLDENFTHEFNEVLALGYLPNQKIDYHDDGEKELGPTVATLSLGHPAKMMLRMKRKYFNGMVDKSKILLDEPVLPGAQDTHGIRSLLLDWAHKDPSRLGKQSRAIMGGQLAAKFKPKNSPDCITMELKHGDIVIMHGAAVQKYFEHSVIPYSGMRYALTSRHIDPESVAPEDMPDFEASAIVDSDLVAT